MSKTSILTTSHALDWLARSWFVHDPRPNLQQLYDTYIREGESPQLARREVWEAPSNIQQIEIADQWRDNVPLYSPFNVWEVLGVSTGYSKWKKEYDLPDLLTAGQAAYLVKFKRAKQLGVGLSHRELDGLFNPHAPAHPKGWAVMQPRSNERGRRVMSKVGLVYGTWKLTKCLSESESTANNNVVIYECVCTVCKTSQRLDYRRLSKTQCRGCKVANAQPKRRKLAQPVMAYVMRDNSLFVSRDGSVPDGAKAVFRILYSNERINMQPLTGDEPMPELDYVPPVETSPEGSTESSADPAQAALATQPPQPQPPAAPPPLTLDAILAKDDIPL